MADASIMDIDRDGIRRVGDRINLAQGEFGRLARELETQLATMQRDWQGEGGAAFGRLMAEWQQRQGEITRLLQAFEDSLGQTRTTSAQQDASQATSMLALDRLLNP
jgi:WXG100 family type VII secretion target